MLTSLKALLKRGLLSLRIRRERHMLSQFNPELFSDIGKTQLDIDREIAKGFKIPPSRED